MPYMADAPINREKSKKIGSLGHLWYFIAPYKGRLIVGSIAILITTVAMVSIPQYVRIMVDSALKNGNVEQLDQSVMLLVATIAVMVGGIFIRTLTIRYTGIKIVADVRKKAYAHVITLDTGFFEETRTGEIISRLVTDITTLRDAVGTQIPFLIRGIALLIGSLAMLFYTNTKLTFMMLSVAPAIIFLAIYLGEKWRYYSREIQQRIADISAQVEESIGSLRTVRSFSQEEMEKDKLNESVDSYLKLSWRWVLSVASFFSFNVFVGFASIALVMWVGGRDVIAGGFTVGEMMAYFLYIAFLGDAFSSITGFWPSLQSAAGATERLFELLNTKPTIVDLEVPTPFEENKNGRKVTFKDVTFCYPTRPEFPAVNNLLLEVEAGATVAIVGPSGAGKSTLFHLILRFYDPQKGKILIDGIDIKNVEQKALRKEVAVVAQDSAIFSTSIIDNIRYGKPDATMEEVIAAAKIANIDTFISELPNQYDTLVGEKGIRLSGGQKQRLSIARTILKDPSILLLDEATSHLDAESEKKVQLAFDKLMKNRTTIVVAHRLSTIMDADKIIVMDKGDVVAVGKHKELLLKSSLYSNLSSLQFIN
jgi:ATP-binding cassette subfamily B protein